MGNNAKHSRGDKIPKSSSPVLLVSGRAARFSRALLIGGALALGSFCGALAPLQTAFSLPPGAASLPEVGAGSGSYPALDATNSAEYREFVPAELFPLLRSGGLVMEVARETEPARPFGAGWGRDAAAVEKSLTAQASLRLGLSFSSGFVFGDVAALTEGAAPQKDLAKKILWNGAAAWAAAPVFSAEFEFHWLREAKPERTLHGELVRLYPAALPETKQQSQFFRELVRFTAPGVLKDLSWLSFRFLGAEEDVLWVFSPAIQKLRQLTGTNRADPFLTSAVTPEELFVWSGKIESEDASVEREQVGFVPLLRNPAGTTVLQNGCRRVDRRAIVDGQMTSRWNFDSSRFPQGAAWLPASTVFVPRPLWRIELNSQDPFRLYGRQVLYVDQTSMLPMYKFVYDRLGHLWKTVIGAYGFMDSGAENTRHPYPAYVIVIDHAKNRSFILDFALITLCDSTTAGLELSDLEPKRFEALAAAAAPAGAPTVAAAAAELDPHAGDD